MYGIRLTRSTAQVKTNGITPMIMVTVGIEEKLTSDLTVHRSYECQKSRPFIGLITSHLGASFIYLSICNFRPSWLSSHFVNHFKLLAYI